MLYTSKLYTIFILYILYIPLCYSIPNDSTPIIASEKVVSNIKDDEYIQFFRTAAWFDNGTQSWHIPIHGWVYEPVNSIVRKRVIKKALKVKYDLSTTPQTQKNFDTRVNLLIADNERDKRIIIKLGSKNYQLPISKPNGHFKGLIKLSQMQVDQISVNSHITYQALTSPQDKRLFTGDVALLSSKGVSVISDIDDTVKISEVTNRKALMNYTFYQDFISAPGMLGLYQKWSSHGAKFHFVSSSPWHLYSPLLKFTTAAGYPWASFSLKSIRFKDNTILNLFKKGTETKPKQIEPILQAYPNRKFILVGDSGEQDPEVYGKLYRQYPTQILRIFIRNVNNSTASDNRYKVAFSDIKQDKWQLFSHPNEIKFSIAKAMDM